MKILLISNMYPSKRSPQYGVFVRNTLDILQKNNFSVQKIVMHRVSSSTVKVLYYLFFYIKIILYVLIYKYDYIYIHYASFSAPPVLVLNKFKKNLKIITNVHGSDVIPEKKVQDKFQPYVRELLKISKIVITPSHYFAAVVKEKYNLASEKIRIFPSGGIDTNKFRPVSYDTKIKLLCEYGLSKKNLYIGFVSRIEYGKGWDIFLSAIKILKEKKLFSDRKALIVGNGKQYNQMQEIIKQYNLTNNIICIDPVSQENLTKIYNLMDVFCFPTMRKGESLGLVGLEAMACGIPVVGSRIGGLIDYINDGKNGLFFDVGNPADLAEKLEKYLNLNADKKSIFKKNALITADKYSKSKIPNDFIKIFKEIGEG